MIRLLTVSNRLSRHVFQTGMVCWPAFTSLGCAVSSAPESEPEAVASIAQAVTPPTPTEVCNQDPRVNLGMVPLAVGSQTNGSVIRPGSYCGVFAFKPSHGLISRFGVLAQSRPLDHIGVFARTLEDLALIAEPLIGFDARDRDTRLEAAPRLLEVAGEDWPLAPDLALVKARLAAFAGLVMDEETFHDTGARLSFRVPAEKVEEIGRLIVDLTSGRAEIGD